MSTTTTTPTTAPTLDPTSIIVTTTTTTTTEPSIKIDINDPKKKQIIEQNEEKEIASLYKWNNVWNVIETIAAFVAEPLCGTSIVGNVYILNATQTNPTVNAIFTYMGIAGTVVKGIWLFAAKKHKDTVTSINNLKSSVTNV